MAKKTMSSLETAEALGEIKTVPDLVTAPDVPEEETLGVIDDPQDFRVAVGNAQMEGHEYIEVSERLFNHLARKSKTAYLTYGEPGVKVFKVGTREEIEKIEKMSAENYGNYMGRKAAENAPR